LPVRTPKTLIPAIVAIVAAAISAAAPAVADPIGGSGEPVTPKATDIVGVGSNLTQSLFDQLSLNYNETVKASAPHLYSWDATNPATGAAHDLIKAKAGCAKAPRPDGALEGILGSRGNPLGLTADTRSTSGTFCTDFARSSGGRERKDPPPRRGGVVFVPVAMDGVTYATNPSSNAPGRLTTAQLASIYTCKVTNWRQVGGKDAPIDAQLPPVTSATAAFFLTALGGQAPLVPGRCVDSDDDTAGLPHQNEGVSKYLQGPNVIFPYSIASYLAQAYHSAKCLTASCTPVDGVICSPTKGQNRFGCDTHGALRLRMINQTRPALPFPLPAPGTCTTGCPVLNPDFSPSLLRTFYVVVRWASRTPHNIPANLQHLFGPNGWIYTSKTAKTDLGDYGFGPVRWG
jgi:ABC-type phosphate transport system substrate-binding protein